MKYQSALAEESKLHREYLERYNERMLYLVGALGSILLGILAFFNFKSEKDIRNRVDEKFRENIDRIINERTKEYSEKTSELDVLISDLKNKEKFVNTLLLDLSGKMTSESKSLPDFQKLKNKLILWVDDNPENNEYPISILKEAGVIIKIFKTSSEGVEFLQNSQKACDLIISNMGRTGNEKAGLEFINELKQKGIKTPIIIFTRPTSIRKFSSAAIEAGAKKCVTGYAQLLSQVQIILGV